MNLARSVSSFDMPITISNHIHSLNSYTVPPCYSKHLSGILLSNGDIRSRVQKLAFEIYNFYKNEPFTIIVMLKGAFKFFQDLHLSLQKLYESNGFANHLNIEFVKLSHYKNSDSTRKAVVKGIDLENLAGKRILVIEDLVGRGVALQTFVNELKENKAKDVQVAVLIDKVCKRDKSIELPLKFVGYLLTENLFTVGYGMDFNEQFRDLKHLAVLNQEGFEDLAID